MITWLKLIIMIVIIECLLDTFFIFEIQQFARFGLLWVYYHYYFSWNRVSLLSSPHKSFISQRFSSIVNFNIVAFVVVVISTRYRSYLYIRSPLLVCHINHIPSKRFNLFNSFPIHSGWFSQSYALCYYHHSIDLILLLIASSTSTLSWSQTYSRNSSNCLSIWVYLVLSSFIPFLWLPWECKVGAV